MPWRCQLSWLIGLVAGTAALAQVDPQVHQQCLAAKDYSGCVQHLSGSATQASGSSQLLEQLLEQQQLYLQAVQAAGRPNRFVGTIYNCKKLRHALAQFNAAVPNAYRVDYQRQFEAAVFGEVEACAPQSDEIEAQIEQLRGES